MKKLNKNQGITLIALVITIIVMLILVSVTLNMISGENGILGKAERAVSETIVGTAREETQLYVSEGVSEYYSKVYVEHDSTVAGKTVAKYIEDGVPEGGYETASGNKITVADGIVTCTDKNGNVLYKQKLSEDGTLTSIPEIPEELKIGSEVSYSPSGTYDEWTTEHSGYKKSYSLASGTAYSSKTEEEKASLTNMSITSWKVFSIDESTGKVQLVPTSATYQKLFLKFYNGYNNSVKLLNEACSSLYGNSSKGIIARSINIEDIEAMLDYDITMYTNTGVNKKYGERLDSAYDINNSNYPKIYEQEANRTIKGTTTTTGLGLSDKANDWISGKTMASNIQPMQTYYYLSTSDFSSKLKSITNGATGISSYSNLLLPNGCYTNYWVASRCVNLGSNNCDYKVRCVKDGTLNGGTLTTSPGYLDAYDYYSLFPVVSLSSELISTDSSGNFEVK